MSTSAGLAMVGEVARLLNGELGLDSALAAVAETIRRGTGAESVTIWARDRAGSGFAAVTAPAAAAPTPRTVATLDAIGDADAAWRIPLVHDGSRLGLLEVRPGGAADRVPVGVVADVVALFLASLALSQDLAVEVATQSREIEAQRRFTDLVIDTLPVGLYVVDRDYRIQIWNRKRETGTQGLRRSEVVGRPVFDVLTRQPADRLRAEFDRVFATGEVQQTDIEVDAGGETRFYRITRIPMRFDGDAITHVITIGEDVTEARATQARILQSEKLAAIGQLAAGVMHEINNPLATISACAEAITARVRETPATDATLVEYLEIIGKEVQRCTNIVDGLLDFSRPKGKAKGPVALPGLLEDTLFLVKHHQRFKRIAVARELDPALPPVFGNAEQLIQVFMALMLNALDAMDEEGGRLTVRAMRSRQRGDEVVVEVEDTGVGIPRAEQSKIFEPFYTTKPPGRGTGLGLSICYGIVEAHRGRLEVESQPGRGSTFRVVLPVWHEGDGAAGGT